MTNRNTQLLSAVALTGILLTVVYGIKGSFASGEGYYGAASTNPTYSEECGACHMV